MIQIHGVITDPAGKLVPGAIIELRSLSTTGEVLMGSAMTFKCDLAGGYRFQLAAGTYDVYAQNDRCGDMDYMGTGVVTTQSADGSLNSILVDNGINLTPPLLERAVDAMNRSESAAISAELDKQQTGNDVIATGQASEVATKQAKAAAASAMAVSNAENEVTRKAFEVDQSAKVVADHAARVEVQSADVAESAAIVAQQSLAVAVAEESVTEMRDLVVTKTAAAQNAATSAGIHASNAEKAAHAADGAKAVTLEKAGVVATLAQEVSANSALVQERATQVAAHAATVAGQAKEVSTNARVVSQAKNTVEGMQEVVVEKTAQALAAADTASDKASQAAQDQAAASTSAQRAGQSESMAEAWAQNPEGSDINGRPGEFSALHWALQAQKWAQAITSQLVWAGPWNAAAGAPVEPAANQGVPFYRVSHPGVIASISYVAGDYLHWDPTTRTWFKIDGSDAVISVNGMTGAVVLSAADVGARPASWVPGWADITNKPVTMPPSEHNHPWSQISNIPVHALRWPTLAEVGAAAASHTHPWSQLTGIPAYAARWPTWGEVTDKPSLAPASHRHPWNQIDQIPATASRWPSWAEVTNKPDLAATNHNHPGSWLNPINLSTEDLDSLKEPKVYAQHANANTSAARHYPENSAGSLTVSIGAGPQQTYRVYNSSRVWTRAQYSTGAWTAWAREYNTLNKPSPAEIGALPVQSAGGVLEVGKYIDFHDAGSSVDYSVRLMQDGTSLRIQGSNGYVDVGAKNTGYAHYYTDRPQHYFDKNVSANDYQVRSDARLKSDLQEVSGALNKTKSLKGWSYDKRLALDSTEIYKREVGLIAQDVQAVLPEAVHVGSDEDGLLTISPSALIALLVEAVKELDRKIEALHGRPQ